MIQFKPDQTWLFLGTGDIEVVTLEDTEDRLFLCVSQTERGPVKSIGITEASTLMSARGELPKNSIFIESTTIESLDILIGGLEALRLLMQKKGVPYKRH